MQGDVRPYNTSIARKWSGQLQSLNKIAQIGRLANILSTYALDPPLPQSYRHTQGDVPAGSSVPRPGQEMTRRKARPIPENGPNGPDVTRPPDRQVGPDPDRTRERGRQLERDTGGQTASRTPANASCVAPRIIPPIVSRR